MKLHSIKHLDAAQNVFFARDLESIDPQEYLDLVPGRLARRFFPAIEGVAAWANVYTYRRYTLVGNTQTGSKHGNALPRVTLTATEASRNIKPINNKYQWTLREIQQAAGTNTPLDRLTVLSAMTATEQEQDDLIALGSSAHGIEGMLNQTGVTGVTATAKTGGIPWLTAGNTADEVLADINKIVFETYDRLKQTDSPGFQKFTLLMPTAQYGHIAMARLPNTEITILQFALKNNPWLEAIEPWQKCDGAGAMGADRMMCYPRNPLWGGYLVPEEFRSHSPQERDLEVHVPTSASCGGGVIRYLVATSYMDGI